MSKPIFLIIFSFLLMSCQEKETKSETTQTEKKEVNTAYMRTNGDSTSTYAEVIHFYKNLAENHESITLTEHYKTDYGEPLHLVEYASESASLNSINILINNGIHPGEPGGIDASMLFFKDLAEGKIELQEDIKIYSIPIYNVGGSHDRNSTWRTNQNGPSEYGFRGNAKNYDLNRDFIKSDSKNSKAFFEIYHKVKPHIFIDTHATNGADYPYVLTHIFTQQNQLGGELSQYMTNRFIPEVKDSLTANNWDSTPYVNVFNRPPDGGFNQFLDSPRYSTGYSSLWNSIGLVIESHMLKSYKERVEGTYAFLEAMTEVSANNAKDIKEKKEKNHEFFQNLEYYPIQYKLDSTSYQILNFKAFQVDTLKSEITGFDRIKYNRDSTYTVDVKYNNKYTATDSIKIPEAYIIPQQWEKIVELLKWNSVTYHRLDKDSIIEVDYYRIADFKTSQSPFEGHYLHSNTKVKTLKGKQEFREGDIVVKTDQRAIRYILETLEPQAVDSYFNWNFFDSVLQQKEHFSTYIFEDMAVELLENNPDLQEKFDKKKDTDKDFSKNWYAQLSWLHKQSKHYEDAHLKYPVYRLMK